MLVLYIILVKEGYLLMLNIILLFLLILLFVLCFMAAFYVAHLISIHYGGQQH